MKVMKVTRLRQSKRWKREIAANIELGRRLQAQEEIAFHRESIRLMEGHTWGWWTTRPFALAAMLMQAIGRFGAFLMDILPAK